MYVISPRVPHGPSVPHSLFDSNQYPTFQLRPPTQPEAHVEAPDLSPLSVQSQCAVFLFDTVLQLSHVRWMSVFFCGSSHCSELPLLSPSSPHCAPGQYKDRAARGRVCSPPGIQHEFTMRRQSSAQIGAMADAALDSSGESSDAEEDDEFGLPRRRGGPIVRSVSSELLDDSRPKPHRSGSPGPSGRKPRVGSLLRLVLLVVGSLPLLVFCSRLGGLRTSFALRGVLGESVLAQETAPDRAWQGGPTAINSTDGILPTTIGGLAVKWGGAGGLARAVADEQGGGGGGAGRGRRLKSVA